MRLGISLLLLLITASAAAQNKTPADPAAGWQLLDRQKDHVNGTSVEKAYQQLLKGKKSHPVIVAVIDEGVDTAHEDLQGHIWYNIKEVPDNGLDDDADGYIDDLYGWNFLGGRDGRDILSENLELDREYFRLRPTYASIADSPAARAAHLGEYAYWMKLKQDRVRDSANDQETIGEIAGILHRMVYADSILKIATMKDTLYFTDLAGVAGRDSLTDSARNAAINFYQDFQISHDKSLESFMGEGNDYLESLNEKNRFRHTDPNARRRDIVGDDPDNIADRNYGNNHVFIPSQLHGTHVSGIIAAIRGNGIGTDGIAANVKIMSVRAACEGDERDKDVALAIRYAVDHGARVINMSFGKTLSPGKDWVDAAVIYAGKKNVLLVHAAGNESENNDSVPSYPNARLKKDHRIADNFIEVGASANGPDSLLAAGFSNYGGKVVDLFAPGVNIYSTIPGNKYASESGTSMASPVVAGVAALVLEYYPQLTAARLKYILLHSVTTFPGLKVRIPGHRKTREFSKLSASGGIVNAYEALKLAGKMTTASPKKPL